MIFFIYILLGFLLIINLLFSFYLYRRLRKTIEKELLFESSDEVFQIQKDLMRIVNEFRNVSDIQVEKLDVKLKEIYEIMDITDQKIIYLNEFIEEVDKRSTKLHRISRYLDNREVL